MVCLVFNSKKVHEQKDILLFQCIVHMYRVKECTLLETGYNYIQKLVHLICIVAGDINVP